MKTKSKKKYWYLVLTMAVVLLVIPLSINRMNDEILNNAQLMGREIATRFALNEEIQMEQYETILDTMEYQLRVENRTDDISLIMKRYLQFVHETMDIESVEIYAAMDGKIKAATHWEGDEAFDPGDAEWYQKALAADGETIYTDVYMDVRLQQQVVTLAKRIQGTEDVVAVDVYPDKTGEIKNMEDLPEGSFYYLSDSKGTLLDFDVDTFEKEEVQKMYDFIFREILEGKHETYDSHVVGIDGNKRGVYYYQLDSGWYTVVTIPYESLLATSADAWRIFITVIFVFFIIAILFVVVDARTSRKARLYNEIVNVLGNSYYALYMVQLEQGQYMMLKGSDYVRSQIPNHADYRLLQNVMRSLIEEKDCDAFMETFSIENMRELVKKRVRDFGGDFRRLFNNEYRWVHVQMLYDESLQKNSVVLCFKDVDEAKKQELSRLEFFRESLESVDRMAKSKNRFFSQMSHDMRTPLNGIIGLSKLAMEQPWNEEKTKETFQKISMLSSQLLGLINDILDMSKMEEGNFEVRSESFSLKKRLREVASVFGIQKDRNFQVDLNIEDVLIRGDWGKIQQILNNLLSNAFKFTKTGGSIRLSVNETIDPNSRYRNYYFVVQDNGVGMSQGFIKKIFIPFERDVQFGAAKVAGTGLGMPIVHELVQKMEGTIDVTSRLGEGSTFEVMIPLLVDEEQNEVEEGGENEAEDISLAGTRVLLTEDNEINMEIATEVLKMYDVEVIQAWNGKEAVERFEKEEDGYFDVILMDMQMPVMGGCEAATAIRKLKKKYAKTVPIIAVTANAFAEDIALTKKAGMDAHISKPIDFQILKETITELLKKPPQKE